MHIQITTSTFGKAGNKPIDYLKKNGVDFKMNPYQRKLTEEEAISLLQGVKGVIAGTEPYTENVLANLPDLKIISRCGIATDNIDLRAARERSEEHTSELQSRGHLVCRLLLEKKKQHSCV